MNVILLPLPNSNANTARSLMSFPYNTQLALPELTWLQPHLSGPFGVLPFVLLASHPQDPDQPFHVCDVCLTLTPTKDAHGTKPCYMYAI